MADLPDPNSRPDPSRRNLLVGAAALLAGAVLVSCGRTVAGTGATGVAGAKSMGAAPGKAPGEAIPEPAPRQQYTVGQLLEQTPFYVAHRGSGDNWTEHSMQAYRESAAHGMAALEVSVNATLDGVFVCHHDTNLARLTGDPRKISQLTFAELGALSLDARQWLGPSAPLQPIPALHEVLDDFAASHVVFVEDKQGTNTEALLDLMDSYPDSTNHFIWKQSSRGAHTAAVQARGYRVWGYFDADQAGMFAGVVPTLDLVGLSVDAGDGLFRELLGYGKPVIAWEVHTRSERDRLAALGVQGMMCSNILYVRTDNALHGEDTFDSGLRAAGDLPGVLDKGWGVQPTMVAASGTIAMQAVKPASYLMGSLCPMNMERYTVTVQLRWPEWLPGPQQHAGIAFGQDSDSPYIVGEATSVSGYHLVLRAGGELALYSRAAGDTAGTLLGAIQTDAVMAQQWVSLAAEIAPGQIRVSRDQDPAWGFAVDDTHYRGGYLSMCKNYPEPLPVEFRGISSG